MRNYTNASRHWTICSKNLLDGKPTKDRTRKIKREKGSNELRSSSGEEDDSYSMIKVEGDTY